MRFSKGPLACPAWLRNPTRTAITHPGCSTCKQDGSLSTTLPGGRDRNQGIQAGAGQVKGTANAGRQGSISMALVKLLGGMYA